MDSSTSMGATAYTTTHLTPPEPSTEIIARSWRLLSSQSWPAPVSKVSGWRKGGKEMMEDILEKLKLGHIETELEHEILQKAVDSGLDTDNRSLPYERSKLLKLLVCR